MKRVYSVITARTVMNPVIGMVALKLQSAAEWKRHFNTDGTPKTDTCEVCGNTTEWEGNMCCICGNY